MRRFEDEDFDDDDTVSVKNISKLIIICAGLLLVGFLMGHALDLQPSESPIRYRATCDGTSRIYEHQGEIAVIPNSPECTNAQEH